MSELQSEYDRLTAEYRTYCEVSERELSRSRDDVRRVADEGLEREAELDDRIKRVEKECQALEVTLEVSQ